MILGSYVPTLKGMETAYSDPVQSSWNWRQKVYTSGRARTAKSSKGYQDSDEAGCVIRCCIAFGVPDNRRVAEQHFAASPNSGRDPRIGKSCALQKKVEQLYTRAVRCAELKRKSK
ncbi:hypothetical protein L1887_02361 [Cichorium endivia]|nr:hypothetical protein L1887_02361 [Cichorium endivia]